MCGYWGKIGRLRQMMVATSVLLAGCLWMLLQDRQHNFTPLTGDDSFGNSAGHVDIGGNVQSKDLPGLETFKAIDERPLFSSSRRPSEVHDQDLRGRKGELIGKYLLQGIVIGDEQRLALLVDPATNKTLRLAEGEDIGEWVAKEIGEDFVRFESRGVERMIRLAKPVKEPGN